MLLTEDEVLMGYRDTDQNVSAKSLTLLIFGWALCGRPQPEHESVMSAAVTFSVKRFNQFKTLSSVRKHLQKVVYFILFIYSRAFNNNVISNGKSYCCNNTFTDVRFTITDQRIATESWKLLNYVPLQNTTLWKLTRCDEVIQDSESKFAKIWNYKETRDFDWFVYLMWAAASVCFRKVILATVSDGISIRNRLLRRHSWHWKRLYALVLSICLFVRSFVCFSVAKMRAQKRDFPQN